MIVNDWGISRREFIALLGASAGATAVPAWAEITEEIAPQPYFASVMRAVVALADAGQPIAKDDADRLASLAAEGNADAVNAAERILNRYTLAQVNVGAGGAGAASWGAAQRALVEQGWKLFLVRVLNSVGSTGSIQVSSGRPIWIHGEGPGKMSQPNLEQRAHLRDTLEKAPLVEKMWLLAQMPKASQLTGLQIDYLVIDLFSRDKGERRAPLAFHIAREYYALRPIDFAIRPSRDVPLRVLDSDGMGCMASFIIKDDNEHIYPPQVMRIAPDMAFHPQIYRADGETVRLPDGEYEVTSWRGPEYLREPQLIQISGANPQISVRLQRWIDPARWGWYSGDPHIHAAGCAHYVHPTEGVSPETMIRHVRGEALSIGNALNWGPSWYYQKQFFSGHAISPEAVLEHPDLQAANNTSLKTRPTPKDHQSLLRYSVEVSGFPSSFSGHLILLNIQEQDYPGAKLIEEWPSWNLPILKWARAQGGVVGFAHCSAGMRTESSELPNYEIPSFDSIGTNEAIVDVTHEACDFLSGCQGQPAAELNAWYHMLNCGYRLAMVGETDFPCFFDDRVGMGRTYVHLDRAPTDDAGYVAWVQGIKSGRLYCGDGRSHFLDFTVNGRAGGNDLSLHGARLIDVRATVAARLEAQTPVDRNTLLTNGNTLPQWHIENARIGQTNTVPVELVVNGRAVERLTVIADGRPRPIRFKTRIERSSWIALRIMPSGHTHPAFVIVDDKPIRASQGSAQWLRECVDVLWNEKHRLMRDSEQSAAAAAYDHARHAYDRIIAESDVA